jgi:hypothetical protein
MVRQDDSGRVDGQRLLDQLPRIDAGAVDGATEQFLEFEHPMPVVEVQAAEHLVRPIPEPGQQEGFRIGGTANCFAAWQCFLEIPPREFGQRTEHCQTGVADAIFGG